MKKKVLWNTGFVCGCVVVLVMISSCEMFTTSFGENSVRDQLEMLENASVSDLADMAGTTQSANPETAVAIMEALAKDTEALKSLNKEQKENILDLALDTTIPMNTITEILKPLLDDMSNNVDTNMTDTETKDLVNDIFENVNSFNTIAVTTLLADANTMKTADPTVLANAAVASIAQIAKKVGIEKFMGTGDGSDAPTVDFEKDSTDAIVGEFLPYGTGTKADRDALKAAVDIMKLLQNPKGTNNGSEKNSQGVTRTDINPEDVKLLGVVSLADILGAL